MGLGPRWSGTELHGPAMFARGPYTEVEILRRLGMKMNAHIAHGVFKELLLSPDKQNAVTRSPEVVRSSMRTRSIGTVNTSVIIWTTLN